MKFEIYKQKTTVRSTYEQLTRRWRWRLRGGNGRIIAASSQAFASKQAAKNNAKLTRDRLASISFRAWKQS